MPTITDFDPIAAGLKIASGPIKRKARSAAARQTPKPRYADAVWYSFSNDHPLEATVPTKAVEDTVRALKRAARYLERTQSTKDHPVEVRVQIGVEALEAEPGQQAKSVVKFLGHKPWMLGRRIAKADAEATAPPAGPGRHRQRTVAGTRGSAQHRARLRRAMVWSVITRKRPSPHLRMAWGSLRFCLLFVR